MSDFLSVMDNLSSGTTEVTFQPLLDVLSLVDHHLTSLPPLAKSENKVKLKSPWQIDGFPTITVSLSDDCHIKDTLHIGTNSDNLVKHFIKVYKDNKELLLLSEMFGTGNTLRSVKQQFVQIDDLVDHLNLVTVPVFVEYCGYTVLVLDHCAISLFALMAALSNALIHHRALIVVASGNSCLSSLSAFLFTFLAHESNGYTEFLKLYMVSDTSNFTLVDDMKLIGFGNYSSFCSIVGQCSNIELYMQSPSVAIITEDCDISSAVDDVIRSLYYCNGQVSTCSKIIMVQESIKTVCLDLLKDRMSSVECGIDKVSNDCGPLMDQKEKEKCTSLIEQTLKEGGCQFAVAGQCSDPNIVCPQFFTDVQTSDLLFQTLHTAPIGCVVGFKSIKEAISIANSLPAGCSASVYCELTNRTLELTRKLDFGCVWVNCSHKYHHIVPHQGTKQAYFNSICVDTFPINITQSIVVSKDDGLSPEARVRDLKTAKTALANLLKMPKISSISAKTSANEALLNYEFCSSQISEIICDKLLHNSAIDFALNQPEIFNGQITVNHIFPSSVLIFISSVYPDYLSIDFALPCLLSQIGVFLHQLGINFHVITDCNIGIPTKHVSVTAVSPTDLVKMLQFASSHQQLQHLWLIGDFSSRKLDLMQRSYQSNQKRLVFINYPKCCSDEDKVTFMSLNFEELARDAFDTKSVWIPCSDIFAN